ncbi:MAG: alanine--tRNA ligase, partial [Elusimicrobiota bacterium]
QPDGTLKPLPKKNIDTGMGLERLTTLVQNVESCFMTDLFKPIMIETVNLLGINVSDVDIKELRIIADHVRSTTMLCSDGIVPSNEGRGYVLRRILRRAVRQGKMLASAQKVELKPFVYKLAGFVAQHMKPVYPDIETHREQITSIVKMEEEKFLETLDTGTEMLEQVLRELSSKGNKIIPGSEVFKLYDTYGFPADLTNDIAVENGFTIDTEGFDKLVTSSRELARSAWKGSGKQELGVYKDLYTKVGNTKFVGYETIRDVTEIVGLVSNNVMVDAVSKGSEVEVILKETPFYAEQGGQIGDTGIIIAQDGYGAKIDIKIVVSDTQKMVEGLVVHRGKVVEGTARIGEKVEALVDSDRRKDIQRNHTATHLLHRALRQTLGLHVVQSGSLVTNERLRFDFAHPKALSGEQIESLELIVNNAVLESYCVNTSVTTLEKAIKDGVMALFGEKYGANVRVVKVGKVKVDCEESKASDDCFSMELCGGTHIKNTGEIGLFKILSESSVAAGTRRIEAITGHSALKYVVGLEKQQYELAELLHTQPQQLNQKLVKVITENKALEKKVEELESKLAGAKQGSETTLITSTVNGIKLVTDVLSGISAKALGEYGDRIRKSIGSGIVVVGSVYQDKPFLVVQITKDLVDKGVNANTIIKDIAKEIGGSGGGKPDFAQAGGKNVDGLKTAVDKAGDAVKSLKF